jgi:hypothetical protein
LGALTGAMGARQRRVTIDDVRDIPAPPGQVPAVFHSKVVTALRAMQSAYDEGRNSDAVRLGDDVLTVYVGLFGEDGVPRADPQAEAVRAAGTDPGRLAQLVPRAGSLSDDPEPSTEPVKPGETDPTALAQLVPRSPY